MKWINWSIILCSLNTLPVSADEYSPPSLSTRETTISASGYEYSTAFSSSYSTSFSTSYSTSFSSSYGKPSPSYGKPSSSYGKQSPKQTPSSGNWSPDGKCGASNGRSCFGSMRGNCCGKSGLCGGTDEYCGDGCQHDYGYCSDSFPPRKNRRWSLFPSGKYTCPGSDNAIITVQNGDTFKVQCFQDHSGGDMATISTSSLDDCVAQCSTRQGCVQVSFSPGIFQGTCYLKNKINGASNNVLIWGATKVSSANPTTTTTTAAQSTATSISCPASNGVVYTATCGARYEVDCGSAPIGIDIGSSTRTSSLGECADKCSANEDCVGISWIQSSSTCSLKRRIYVSLPVPNIHAVRKVSGCISSTTTTTTSASSTQSQCITKSTPTASSCVPCEGQPGSDPEKWCGYDINTDYFKYVPKTCKTRYYTLRVQNMTVAPDGIERIGLVVNGQSPGPALEGNWGDTFVVTVINELQNNGTTIHFHGIRQNYTNQQDGVPAITQCPIAPGDQMTYTWVASSYGTSWYHSHFTLQAYEGVYGPLIVHGPHSGPEYDEDKGLIPLSDWSHHTLESQYDIAQDATPGSGGGPRVMDNGLINGKNVWVQEDGTEIGKRHELEFEQGKSYRIRLLNTGVQSSYKFYIDGHSLTVIGIDFTPIVPYQTNILSINIGQRYDVIVKADQPVGDYWMRSDNQQVCDQTIQAFNIKAIVHYVGGPGGVPTSTPYNYTQSCSDEPLSKLVPVLARDATDQDVTQDFEVTVGANNAQLFKWYLAGSTFTSQWNDPTLYHLLENKTLPDYSGNLIIDVPNPNTWVYFVLHSAVPVSHPIHLHGHDHFVLGAGTTPYNSSVPLNLKNPPRRDTTLLPGGGYLVLAFETDNPGIWLMHCHIGWHASMGLALQIAEMKDYIPREAIDNSCIVEDTCKAWRKYAAEKDVVMIDSGI